MQHGCEARSREDGPVVGTKGKPDVWPADQSDEHEVVSDIKRWSVTVCVLLCMVFTYCYSNYYAT